MTPWEVRYARQFHEQLMGLSDATYGHVEDSIDVLAGNPGLARDYDPTYEAARPPASCQCYFVPRTTKVIYLLRRHRINQVWRVASMYLCRSGGS